MYPPTEEEVVDCEPLMASATNLALSVGIVKL